jgi:S1-C subfamily serine protease
MSDRARKAAREAEGSAEPGDDDAPESGLARMVRSVVRIFATTQSPDYESPWQRLAPASGTGSGVVVAPGKIVTGAHVVADATFLQVQKVSDPDKVVAEVTAICHDSDLALLTVRDPAFMKGVVPAELGELPSLRDGVSVVGYPIGGEEISITEGVVSRVEVQRYSHSERELLAVTVDAAINEGNSGGPVFRDGRVVGIAFQSLEDAENIGEMVPTTLIRKFLSGVELGKRAQVPGLGIVTQNLENPELRRRVGLRHGQSGVLVVAVEHGGSAWGHVQIGDALCAVDGQRIANNGTVQYQGRFRTTFQALLGDHFTGDRIGLRLLRDGVSREVEIELKPYVSLVPRSQYDTPPPYFVYAGLVFQPLSLDFLRIWGREWWEKAPPEFLHAYDSGIRTEERQEIVVLTQVLADEINMGYGELDNHGVATVCGVGPRNMRHFVALVEGATDALEILTHGAYRIVLDPAVARVAGARILGRYAIARDRSPDMDP